jgi:hypothetical protein
LWNSNDSLLFRNNRNWYILDSVNDLKLVLDMMNVIDNLFKFLKNDRFLDNSLNLDNLLLNSINSYYFLFLYRDLDDLLHDGWDWNNFLNYFLDYFFDSNDLRNWGLNLHNLRNLY